MAIEYITTRKLEGKKVGKIRILKLQEEADAMVEFTCPECGFVEKRKEAWSSPFIEGEGANLKFNLSCKKCGFKNKILKLKKEAKKKK